MAVETFAVGLAMILRQAPDASPSIELDHSRQIHALPVERCSLVLGAYTSTASERVEDGQKVP